MLNHRTKILTILFISLSLNLLAGCQDDVPLPSVTKTSVTQPPVAPSAESPTSITTGTVIESIDASVYTYVLAEANGENIWLAGPKTTITRGGSIDVDTRAPMRNFHSKALNRDFPVVYFVDHFTGDAVQSVAAVAVTSAADLPPGHTAISDISTMPGTEISLSQPVERAEGGHSIAEIITSKDALAGKVVKVRGKVSKFTGDVMKKNWIHMIDGSGDNDLTVITDQVVTVGQMIVIEGTVLLDKDFGYGYVYELLIDDAKVTIE